MVVINFNPDDSDWDEYGIKIAANNIVLVQANNQDNTYILRYAPYNYTARRLRCSLPYLDRAHFIYSVGVGSSQPPTENPYVYFAGEVVPQEGTESESEEPTGTFIGILINADPRSVQSYLASEKSISCDYFQTRGLEFVSSYGHQEYFVIAVEPLGTIAIGLATDFVFFYQPYPTVSITEKSTTAMWPNDSTFQPCAADAGDLFTVVAGFVKNPVQSRARATPTVHLLWNDDLTVLSSWTYAAPENSWQSYLTYFGLDSWNKKFTMSVKINGDDPTRVLIGMPFLNTVFLFRVTDNGTNLTMINSLSQDKSVGFGKSVTWLSNTQVAILYSAHSLDYRTWYWSRVYLYDWSNDTDLPSLPTAVIPNAQQPLPPQMNQEFMRLVSTPTHMVIVDDYGDALVMHSEPPGSYASTTITEPRYGAVFPMISQSTLCMGGTFKADHGVYPCALCPARSRNPGRVGAAVCINCSVDTFCPLGAVYEMDSTSIIPLSQAVAYPRSPELSVYEDLLINNMVTFGSTVRCLRVSPMFWTVVLLLLVAMMLLAMASLNLCVNEPKRDRWRSKIKNIFLRTDLVVSDAFEKLSMLYSLSPIFVTCFRVREKCGWVASPHSL